MFSPSAVHGLLSFQLTEQAPQLVPQLQQCWGSAGADGSREVPHTHTATALEEQQPLRPVPRYPVLPQSSQPLESSQGCQGQDVLV